ncbi:MAG TPA: hypothetical protein VIK59_05060 [Verrucomicrobiae bacterium]
MMDTSVDADNPSPALPVLLANCDPILELESDDGLVTYMALKDEDAALARRACEELHRRHARFMLGWCLNNRAETFGSSAEDFVNIAFRKAYDKADTFICPVDANVETKRRKVKSWLFLILYNTFLDSRSAEIREPISRSDEDEDGLLFDLPNPNEELNTSNVSPERKTLVWKFIEKQELVDQAILKVTAEYWSPSVNKTVLPDHVRKALCGEFGLTENSLRVRRLRLLERMKNFILENETQNQVTT